MSWRELFQSSLRDNGDGVGAIRMFLASLLTLFGVNMLVKCSLNVSGIGSLTKVWLYLQSFSYLL